MTALILLLGYPVFLALLVLLDWRTGWTVSEAFGVPTKDDDGR